MQYGAYKPPLPAAVLRECQRDPVAAAELIGDADAENMLLRIKYEVSAALVGLYPGVGKSYVKNDWAYKLSQRG
ncbi:MAG: hypothetical protein SPL69_09520, partial [Succinivibrionaceae bacterium]|nr:hypothetical protein [Succinivibrionaceae bacterium]